MPGQLPTNNRTGEENLTGRCRSSLTPEDGSSVTPRMQLPLKNRKKKKKKKHGRQLWSGEVKKYNTIN